MKFIKCPYCHKINRYTIKDCHPIYDEVEDSDKGEFVKCKSCSKYFKI